MERRYAYLFGKEFDELLAKEPVAYLPIGCIERHGDHLPYGLDFFKAEMVCIRIAEKLGGIVLPAHAFAGTHGEFGVCKEAGKIGNIYLDEGLLHSTIKCLLWQLQNCGFRKTVIYTGHHPGSQSEVLQRAVKEFEATDGNTMRATVVNEMIIRKKGDHAGVSETSVMMALQPELVKLDRVKDEHINGPRGYIVDREAKDPRREASVEYGNRVIDDFIKAVGEWIGLVDSGKLPPAAPSPWGDIRAEV